jgi:hypothetical protein
LFLFDVGEDVFDCVGDDNLIRVSAQAAHTSIVAGSVDEVVSTPRPVPPVL